MLDLSAEHRCADAHAALHDQSRAGALEQIERIFAVPSIQTVALISTGGLVTNMLTPPFVLSPWQTGGPQRPDVLRVGRNQCAAGEGPLYQRRQIWIVRDHPR